MARPRNPRPMTADDPGDRDEDGVPLLIDLDGDAFVPRERFEPLRSEAKIADDAAARREDVARRREMIPEIADTSEAADAMHRDLDVELAEDDMRDEAELAEVRRLAKPSGAA